LQKGGSEATDEILAAPPRRAQTWRVASGLAIVLVLVGTVSYLRKVKHDLIAVHEPSLHPSTETLRRPVEQGIDPDAKAIDLTPQDTSFLAMKALVRPAQLESDPPLFTNHRIAPFEMHVWRFKATIEEARLRTDHDIYIVVNSGGRRGCVEIPDPAMCAGSRFLKQIVVLRTQIVDQLGRRNRQKYIGKEAILTGVGFFGTSNKEDNGARLLPLLKLEWVPTSKKS
jgi:hypothetical protein